MHMADVLRVLPRGVRRSLRLGLRPLYHSADHADTGQAIRSGLMYDDPDDEIKPWQIAAFALVIIILGSVAIKAFSNIVGSVA